MKILQCFNRQRIRKVRLPCLKAIARRCLEIEGVSIFELGIHLVEGTEMAELNYKYLDHSGSTDVITFDHGSDSQRVHGEIFVCLHVAVEQAGQFKTSWEHELARYVCHGILHLRGYTDTDVASRRTMKRRENALMKKLESLLDLAELSYG